MIGGVLLSIPVALAAGFVTRSAFAAQAAVLMVMAVLWGPMFALLFRNPRIAIMLAAVPLTILAILAVAILALSALVALGPRFALANLYLDVSVEATPVGRYEVVLVNPPAASDPDRPGGMLHSALYEDAETIRLIGDFIDARLGALATAPREAVHQTPGA